MSGLASYGHKVHELTIKVPLKMKCAKNYRNIRRKNYVHCSLLKRDRMFRTGYVLGRSGNEANRELERLHCSITGLYTEPHKITTFYGLLATL